MHWHKSDHFAHGRLCRMLQVATAGVGLHVTGSLVNRGPDGRGGTILHLTSAGKRVRV